MHFFFYQPCLFCFHSTQASFAQQSVQLARRNEGARKYERMGGSKQNRENAARRRPRPDPLLIEPGISSFFSPLAFLAPSQPAAPLHPSCCCFSTISSPCCCTYVGCCSSTSPLKACCCFIASPTCSGGSKAGLQEEHRRLHVEVE